MAGTIVADTIQDGAGNSTAMDNAIYGSAKAWVSFVGSSGSIRASYNVGSITRNGTGNYTINFTNAISDSNYATFVTANRSASGVDGYGSLYGAGTYSTTAVQVLSAFASSATLQDASIVNVSVFR
jgi:hypothetical protein